MREPLEESLRRAIDQLPHPSLEELSRMPVPLMTGHDEITRPVRRRPAARRLAAYAAALALMLGGGGWYFQTQAVASIVDLDINPSFEITANRLDRVLTVIPVNEDAQKSLPDLSFRNMPLGDAVASLVGGLHEEGYLQERGSVLLLSVGGPSGARAQRIEQSLTERIEAVLGGGESQAAVVRQSLQNDLLLRSQAQDYRVSEGRMQLVNQILAQEPAFSRERLLEMSVGELVALAERYGFTLEGAPAAPGRAEEDAPAPRSGRSVESDEDDDHDESDFDGRDGEDEDDDDDADDRREGRDSDDGDDSEDEDDEDDADDRREGHDSDDDGDGDGEEKDDGDDDDRGKGERGDRRNGSDEDDRDDDGDDDGGSDGRGDSDDDSDDGGDDDSDDEDD